MHARQIWILAKDAIKCFPVPMLVRCETWEYPRMNAIRIVNAILAQDVRQPSKDTHFLSARSAIEQLVSLQMALQSMNAKLVAKNIQVYLLRSAK